MSFGLKILILSFISLFVINIFLSNVVYADDKSPTGDAAIGRFVTEANSRDTKKDNSPEGTATNMISAALNIVEIVVFGIAIIMLVAMGMKYLVSSIEDRVEMKKHFVVYFVGVIILFSASGILEILKNFLTQNF